MTNLAIFSPIKLGPVVASPPYTEGEFYSVEKRKVAVQVTKLSSNLIFVTFYPLTKLGAQFFYT